MPEFLDQQPDPRGTLAGVRLGPVGVFTVSGTPQVVWRTTSAVRRSPGDLIKVCVQRHGRATVQQDGHEVALDPHLDDPALSRSSIAAAHRMSARTLDRLFADQPWSVSGLIRHERLEAVRRDLADPSLGHSSVAALAARWCFFDAAHFSRVFRQNYGCPPSQTRPGAGRRP